MARIVRGFIKKTGLKYVIVAALAAAVFVLSSAYGPQSASGLPTNAKPLCTVPPPVFATWFKSGAVSLNGVVNPANSVTFPATPNCSFYAWSEQMYLWLTSPSPATYGGSGRIFDSPVFFDVSPPDAGNQRVFIPHVPGQLRIMGLRAAQVGPHRLPVIFDKTGKMFEIEKPFVRPNGKPIILNEKGDSVEVERITVGADHKAVFLGPAAQVIKNAKPIILRRPQAIKTTVVQKFIIGNAPVFVDLSGNVIDVEQGQAGGNAVLEAQNGSLVYYATMVNDVYAYFLTGTKDGGIVPKPSQFPTTQAALNKVIAFGAAHGKTFPDANALAIEIKTSWVEAAGLPNPGSYITMKATIPTYNKSNPNQWTPGVPKTVLLAMVGIHVVGSTQGHPEMLWATFEHVNNAPVAAYSYVNTSNQTVAVPQNTTGNWVFCANNSAGPFNAEHMKFSSPDIISIAPFTISPSNTIRWKAWGGASDVSPNPVDATTAVSNTEILSMNNSVRSQLASGDIRSNYIMTGCTWTIGGAAPTGSFNHGSGNEVGTSKLANSTMETYQQGTNTLYATGINCFTCHSANDTSVSHIFTPLQPLAHP